MIYTNNNILKVFTLNDVIRDIDKRSEEQIWEIET